jgi:uncharacterized protein
MKDSPGKTALITGASTGIGRDLAELFARDGHHLILTARNESQLQDLAGKLREQYRINAEVLVQDLSLADGPARIFEQLRSRTIDYLINNAGFGSYGPFAEADTAGQLAMLQVNIVSLTYLTRLFLPSMIQRHGGRIMNVASVAAFLPGPLMAVYYATKAYVLSFSEALATELSPAGITVTALCPGPTTTEFQNRAGIGESPLFRIGVMTSTKVAQLGYNGMMAGKRAVVTGFSNKLSALSTRLVPRSTAAAIAHRLNKKR